MQDIAEVPLSALVSLHLLARDLLAMTQGVSVRSRDAEDRPMALCWSLKK